MTSTLDALNRLSVAHSRSLPSYLSYACPWISTANGKAGEVLLHIAADQRRIVDRLGEMILEHGGTVDPGAYPLRYTALHDLSLDYLLGQLIRQQQDLVRLIESSLSELTLVPRARALAEEALGEAKGHLESLQELGAKPAKS